MRILVTPIYGLGWFGSGTTLDVPPEFLLEAEETSGSIFIGQVSNPGHSLDGYWVALSQRHTVKDGYYNLNVYEGDPRLSTMDSPHISGFAQAALT